MMNIIGSFICKLFNWGLVMSDVILFLNWFFYVYECRFWIQSGIMCMKLSIVMKDILERLEIWKIFIMKFWKKFVLSIKSQLWIKLKWYNFFVFDIL